MTRIMFSGPAITVGTDPLAASQVREAAILVEGGGITRVTPGLDTGADVVVRDRVIAPGFVELQVNGAYGADFTSDAPSVTAASARLPATGVTSFMPTIITSPFDGYRKLLDGVRGAVRGASLAAPDAYPGAEILGVHLEGPYLSPRRPGAHDPSLLRSIDLEEILGWGDPDVVRIVTLAPELPGALPVIRALRDRGIVVSAGHSAATYEEAMAGFEAGVAWGTHLFNAMSALGHRDPGLPGALLASDVPCGLIADGFHVHPAVVKLAYRSKGADGLVLVTDAIEAMGMSPGNYRLAGRTVVVDGSTCRLADGTLAGSILTMDAAVRNMVRFAGCALVEAVRMATATPARVLRLSRKGRIAPGCDADLVVLDEDLRVTQTWVNGRLVYRGA